MTIFSHVISASFIAYTAVNPDVSTGVDSTLLAAAIVTPAALDLDHIVYLVKDLKFYLRNYNRKVYHHARSPLHELFGALTVGIIAFVIAFFNIALAKVIGISLLVHIIEDMLVGKAFPMKPFDKSLISVFSFKTGIKFLLDFLTITIFAILWINYLRG